MEVVNSALHLGVLSGEQRAFGDATEPWRCPEPHGDDDPRRGAVLEVVLNGGAPWGFTLRGGLEYHEPLLITKVEEGSPAASVLQVGDEIVCINAVALSGYRQEAICLVKSSYKTLVLGLRRRNEPLCRPHSWHSSKVSENPSEVSAIQDTAALEPVWQTNYESGSSLNDFTSCWGQTNRQHVSCQFSSVGNMESLEKSSNKPQSGADPSLDRRGVSKHDSAYGSSSSSTADQSLSKCSTPSADCVFYRGSPKERHRYLQIPVSNGGRVSPRLDDQSASRFPSSGRQNFNPVWHIPEKPSTTPLQAPPPPPPLRSDSFAATKVHEKGFTIPYSQGPPAYCQLKSHSRVGDRQFEDYHVRERGPDLQCSFNAPSKKDFLHVYLSTEDYNPNQLNPNKPFSVSSTDVSQGQNHFACQPEHQRQRSDEGPFYIHNRNPSAPKTQSVGSYYRSLQHLPTNSGSQKQARTSMASLSSTALDHNPDGMAHFRYYCITSQQHTQTIAEGIAEDGWGLESKNQTAADWNSTNLHRVQRSKCPTHYLQPPETKIANDHCKQKVSTPVSEAVSNVMIKSNSEEREKEHQWRKDGGIAENQHSKHVPNHHADQRNAATTVHHDAQKDPWVSKNEHKICPQKTPLLHFLAQESQILVDSNVVLTNGSTHQGVSDTSGGKQGRRSDRYATVLRNEIQEKRAQLQKSRSAAALTCPGETEEDTSVWRSTETSTSSSDGSFTNTYKDHLKEAQARVLQATSFKRRDLELPGSETFPGHSSMKPDSGNAHISRIGSRKRFPMDKRVHSFSEPDKINEVGVEDNSSRQAAPGSFVDRCKFFEGHSRPTFSKPISKKSHVSPGQGTGGDKNNLSPTVDSESKSKHHVGPVKSTTAEELQRLGTFAEYEASWNLQRKSSEGRTSNRYHSAENILDSGMEESNSAVCIHERSRSSPSADFHGGKIILPVQKPLEESQPQSTLDQAEIHMKSAERRHLQLSISEPADIKVVQNLEQRDKASSLLSNNSVKASSLPPSYPNPLHLQGSVFERLFPLSSAVPPSQNPAKPRENQCTQQETTSPSSLLEALPSHGESQEKDPRPAAALGSEGRSENEELLHPSTGTNSPSSHQSSSVPVPSVPSSQKMSKEAFGGLRHEDLCSDVMENTSPPSSVWNNIPPIRDTHTQSNSETESKNYLVPKEESADPDEATIQKQIRSSSPESTHSLTHTYIQQSPQTGTNSFSPLEEEVSVGALIESTETGRMSKASAWHSEDEKREELARDIMGKDKSLVDILDQSKMKTTMDLMEGIYPQGEQLLEVAQPRRKLCPKQTNAKNTAERKEDDRISASVAVVTSSTYYSTSAPKAELLIMMKDMQEQMKDQDSEDELDCDLSNKKQELIDSLSQKLQVLREARESLQEDVQDNNALGEEVEATVQAVCKPNELDKFRMFVGDLDKVVSLLLSLSGRLARVENALNNLEEGTSAEEKQTLTEKRKLLMRQHEDAKELKENLDRRERVVYEILASYLSAERLADYRHFVKMKSALIIEQRKLEDRIKLGEEQLKCLRDSLPLEQRLHF